MTKKSWGRIQRRLTAEESERAADFDYFNDSGDEVRAACIKLALGVNMEEVKHDPQVNQVADDMGIEAMFGEFVTPEIADKILAAARVLRRKA
jgi:hypothetical protein